MPDTSGSLSIAHPESVDRGVFICLEGGEGSGKTTMTKVVYDYLKSIGREAREVSDPGSTPLAQRVREIVIDAHCPCTPAQQALLYVTARDALANEIRDLLDMGIDVVCGRWTLSTLVYQGELGGVDIDKIRWLTANFIDLNPDIYILLNSTPEIALTRKREAVGDSAIANDRFDSRPIDWHRAVQNAYYGYAEGKGYPVVDADRPLDEVAAAVLAICKMDARLRGHTGSL